MWKKLCYVILCISLMACNPIKNGHDRTATVDWDKIEYGNLILENIEYIPLETTDQSLLGRVDKILYRKGNYYVLDKKTSGVYVFDKTGKYVSSVCKRGEAPDEYIELMDMDVDEEGNIYVADNARKAVIKYEAPDWNLKQKYDIGNHFHEFAYLGEQSFILKDVYDENGLKTKLSYYDVQKQKQTPILEKTLSEVEELDILKCSKYGLYRSGTTLFYNERFKPEVYSISADGKLNLEYTIASENYISETDLKPLEKNPMKFLQERNCIKDIISLYATDDYFICMPFVAPSATFVFMPKNDFSKSRKVDLMKSSDFMGTSGIEGVVDDKILMVLNKIDENLKLKDKRLINIDEDSNPVLMLCSVKL